MILNLHLKKNKQTPNPERAGLGVCGFVGAIKEEQQTSLGTVKPPRQGEPVWVSEKKRWEKKGKTYLL